MYPGFPLGENTEPSRMPGPRCSCSGDDSVRRESVSAHLGAGSGDAPGEKRGSRFRLPLLDEVLLDADADGLGPSLGAQLGEHGTDVRLDGPDGDREPSGDFLVP